jgi:hypothetical protein
MPIEAFSEFMKATGQYPKLKFEPSQKKELILVNAKMVIKQDPAGKDKHVVRILVQDLTDNEIKQWDTESIVVIDTLRKVEPKTKFSAMPTKRGAKKGWEITVG